MLWEAAFYSGDSHQRVPGGLDAPLLVVLRCKLENTGTHLIYYLDNLPIQQSLSRLVS